MNNIVTENIIITIVVQWKVENVGNEAKQSEGNLQAVLTIEVGLECIGEAEVPLELEVFWEVRNPEEYCKNIFVSEVQLTTSWKSGMFDELKFVKLTNLPLWLD